MRMQDMTEPQLAALMGRCAEAVKAKLRWLDDEKTLFVLLVFNDPAATQYISSCNREDTIRAMRAAADRLETHAEVHRLPIPPDPRQN